MAPEALLIFGLLLHQVPGNGRYPYMFDKSREALLAQSGAGAEVDHARGLVENYAKRTLHQSGLPEWPIVGGVYIYRSVKNQQINTGDLRNPLLRGSRIGATVSQDSVYLRFTLGF